jgi:hypothetical protein
VTGAGAVTALVLLECACGGAGIAAWAQSWGVIRRGHFRIVAWITAVLAALAAAAAAAAYPPGAVAARGFVLATAAAALLGVAAQHARTDVPGAAAGAATAAAGAAALACAAGLIRGWPAWLGGAGLAGGAALLGAVLNGMLLGHWYLNQPGLEPWALARLTAAALGAVTASALVGIAGATRLAGASTSGAVLGLPGFGASFGGIFFAVWLSVIAFTAVVVWLARRCVALRSIQSATGLYYVAVLTAAASEFVVRYLMLHAAR